MRKFGKWTAAGDVFFKEYTSGRFKFIPVQCACGHRQDVRLSALSTGRSTQCKACHNAHIAKTKPVVAKHGMHKTPEYRSWADMKARCHNPRHKQYHRYGGRGINVCESWLSFESFYVDMGARPSSNHTLERVDVNGPYSPENCKWATWKDQYRNRRNTRMITFNGKTQCMKDWADEIGIHPVSLKYRLDKYGWSIERALSTPVSS